MHPTAISEPRPTGWLWGRQVQVETFRSRLRALRFGHGGTVLVTGLAGLGKTACSAPSRRAPASRGSPSSMARATWPGR